MYKLQYLPAARQDMIEIVRYVSKTLSNPAAADQLALEMIEVGKQIAKFPYANPAYIPIKPLRHEYRKRLVRNFLVFYWVEEEKKIVTVARVIYAKRDYERLLGKKEEK